MKYSSIVNDKGEMDFGKVRDFVSAATEAGLEVYGHTLCWHEQQTVKWLNSLIKDKELEVDPNEKVEKVEIFVLGYILRLIDSIVGIIDKIGTSGQCRHKRERPYQFFIIVHNTSYLLYVGLKFNSAFTSRARTTRVSLVAN